MPPSPSSPPAPPRRRDRGFTLIELMVVIVILGLLIGLVGKNVWNALFGAQRDTAKMQMKNYADVIDLYRTRNRGLPKSLEELTQEDPQTKQPYIDKIKNDPWDQPYDYKITDERRGKYEIVSGGDDKALGTDDDIYWPEREGAK